MNNDDTPKNNLALWQAPIFDGWLALLDPSADEDPTLPQRLVRMARSIKQQVFQLGDEATEVLKQPSLDYGMEVYARFLLYDCSERTKHYLLLIRDGLFEHLKGKNRVADGQVPAEALARHEIALHQTLIDALTELEVWSKEQLQWLHNGSREASKQMAQWRVQLNAWPVYKTQLETIFEQCEQLLAHSFDFEAFQVIFEHIRLHIIQWGEDIATRLATLHQQASEASTQLEDTEPIAASELLRRLQPLETAILPEKDPATLKADLEHLLMSLPDKWSATVMSQQGLLVQQEMDLRKKATQWIENQILPLLYEIWELFEESHSGYSIALSNIKNRLLLLPKQEQVAPTIYGQPLATTLKRLDDVRHKTANYLEAGKERMSSDFFLSAVYDTQKEFLPVPAEIRAWQIDQVSGNLLSTVRKVWQKTESQFQHLLGNVKQEENLGYAEKVVRYIEHRQPSPDCQDYTAIFVTRGFVGPSFACGRSRELAQLNHQYAQWQKGYRGAVLLTGRRYCGKTFLGEWFCSQFENVPIIRLEAGYATTLGNRQLEASHNLGQVLDFVAKSGLRKHPIIWMDDLELWQSPEYTLYHNIEALLRFLDLHATRCFVLVGINHLAFQRQERLQNLGSGFQTVLHLDTMDYKDIAKAILVRHGATHKKLVRRDNSQETLDAQQFQQLTKKITRAAHNNIGEALMWWTSSIVRMGDEHVALDFKDPYAMPEHPDTDVKLLLNELLWQKHSTELYLRKVMGQSYTERYVHQLRRLLGIGLVRRLPDGSLEIEETAVNALATYHLVI